MTHAILWCCRADIPLSDQITLRISMFFPLLFPSLFSRLFSRPYSGIITFMPVFGAFFNLLQSCLFKFCHTQSKNERSDSLTYIHQNYLIAKLCNKLNTDLFFCLWIGYQENIENTFLILSECKVRVGCRF